MATYELCVKIPQLINSLHKNMFFQLKQKILTPMLEIWLIRCLIELHCDTLYTLPGVVVLFYNIFWEMLLYKIEPHNFTMCLQTQQTWVWLGLRPLMNPWVIREEVHVFCYIVKIKQHYFICNLRASTF